MAVPLAPRLNFADDPNALISTSTLDFRRGTEYLGIAPNAPSTSAKTSSNSSALTLRSKLNGPHPQTNDPSNGTNGVPSSLVRRADFAPIKPTWHPPWKLLRVISGHLGWVRAVHVEPDNRWFATGAGDRTIKIWDLASGNLRLTLTGHISTVRGLAVSARHPYLFSCGEDKLIKCWDLEANKVVRHYHGHLSGVYALALHPTLDLLVTGGRDAAPRVWDMRTRAAVHTLTGHTGTISALATQATDPQVISSSLDSRVRLWDLAAGKTMVELTHHKKGVRGLALHPTEYTFASASTGQIKQWLCPRGQFMQNFSDASIDGTVVNSLSVNEDNVLFSGADDGSMGFWDWKSGYLFQKTEAEAQPGSLDAERGIFCSTFDRTGLRLITGEADKTIKVWGMDETATEESFPMDWKPTLGRQRH